MPGNSVVNLGNLTKPATVLVEKIADAIGGWYKPHQIRRVAHAEADAEKIRVQAQIEVSDLERRAFRRFIAEEGRKQANMEAIAEQALPLVTDEAIPEAVEDDWISYFFDRCRLISDEEMQMLWARILAGEANTPGTFSKRTMNFLVSLSRADANLFASLARFVVTLEGDEPMVVVPDYESNIYVENGITFDALVQLEAIGVIRFNEMGSYVKTEVPQATSVAYLETKLLLRLPDTEPDTIPVGRVMLSRTGRELLKVCEVEPVDGFVDYLIKHFSSANIVCSSEITEKNHNQPSN